MLNSVTARPLPFRPSSSAAPAAPTAVPSTPADTVERGPLRVVLTGYGPFMGIPVNPADVIGQKVSEMGVQGAKIEYRRLDVNHDAVDAFMRDMRAAPPDVILSLGYSGGQAQVEEAPNNQVGGGREGESHPAGPIVQGQPQVLATDLPVKAIESALTRFPHRTIGTHFSEGAGYHPDRSAYLCDYINYLETDTFGAQGPLPAVTAGFVHVNDSTTPQEVQKVLQAVVDAHHTVA